MSWLKTLPIAYHGQLKEVRILNFAVDANELDGLVPQCISLLMDQGQAIVSMADLQVTQMRPCQMPKWLSVSYRHIAFRVLVDDREFCNDAPQGAYFLKSFCDRPCLVCAGALFTDYQLCRARISGKRSLHLKQGDQFLKCSFGEPTPALDKIDEQRTARLNNGYAVHRDQLWQTQILPRIWPMESVACYDFDTNFFKSARLLGAYQVKGSLDFSRSAPRALPATQRREHLQPFGSNAPLFNSL